MFKILQPQKTHTCVNINQAHCSPEPTFSMIISPQPLHSCQSDDTRLTLSPGRRCKLWSQINPCDHVLHGCHYRFSTTNWHYCRVAALGCNTPDCNSDSFFIRRLDLYGIQIFKSMVLISSTFFRWHHTGNVEISFHQVELLSHRFNFKSFIK